VSSAINDDAFPIFVTCLERTMDVIMACGFGYIIQLESNRVECRMFAPLNQIS